MDIKRPDLSKFRRPTVSTGQTPPTSTPKVESQKPTTPQPPVRTFSTTKSVGPMTSLNKTIGSQSTITGAQKVPQTAVPAKNLKKLFIILGTVGLVILLSLALTLILVFPTASRVIDINIDFHASADIVISDEEWTSSSKILPGDKIDYTFNISTSINEQSTDANLDVFLRIRASISSEDNFFPNTIVLTFTEGGRWFKGIDGFYYLQKTPGTTGVLSPGEKISISRSLLIDKTVGNEFAGKSITIMFEAEVLQAEYQAILEIWPTAPYEWSSQYRDLVHWF